MGRVCGFQGRRRRASAGAQGLKPDPFLVCGFGPAEAVPFLRSPPAKGDGGTGRGGRLEDGSGVLLKAALRAFIGGCSELFPNCRPYDQCAGAGATLERIFGFKSALYNLTILRALIFAF